MRRDGGALVGVGRTITHIMPLSGPAAAADHGHGAEVSPVLDVVAKDVTIGMVTVVTWDHLPGYAVQWRGTGICTALSGSISTILTALNGICVGIHGCGALPSPVLALDWPI